MNVRLDWAYFVAAFRSFINLWQVWGFPPFSCQQSGLIGLVLPLLLWLVRIPLQY
uniref:Uncharacterized protein n=1 Tax=Utricularia reniformis TaxID=192314 RepID=A0A1Y0AZZ3_9LAMI|nr:hypothetical protein AEK19_MT0435 [Utricularia reniformis]ART30698.1 hypothetical protein AEK19_MT0435 [Utricularia reniformis]